MKEILAFKERLFAEGKKKGFSDMEIYYQSSRKSNVKIYQGDVDDYHFAVEGGVSFRGLNNGKMGYAYSEKIEEAMIELLLDEAWENASLIDNDEEEVIFAGSDQYKEIDLYAKNLANVTVEEKIDLMKQLEAACFTLSNKVKSVDYCLLESLENERLIANTKGFEKSEKNNFIYIVISVVVEDGDGFKSAMKFKITKDFSDLCPETLAQQVVDEALSYVGATSITSKHYPIIFKNKAAASLLQVFSQGFFADNVQKDHSPLAGKLGKSIANTNITIIDDPHLQNGIRSQSFDSEGVATRKIRVVENGLLKTYLYNLKTAKKDEVESTGHAYKSSYKGTVTIAPSNMYIQPGENTLSELMAAEEELLIITELQGLHSGANPISGDFSLAAKGYLVKNGKIERPIDQITVAGNFYTLLNQIEAVGNDLQFAIGFDYIGSPSLKVKKLSVGGE